MGDESNPAEDQLVQLSQWSRYNVSQDLRLPVQIVDKDSASSDSLPAVADVVREGLTPINQSVFLYGWSMGVTTITSNRSVVKQIEATRRACEGGDRLAEDMAIADIEVAGG